MAYPENKPTGNYSLRDDIFAENDNKKIPMDDYTFKTGYKNAEESETESVPDAHSQNWLFDILHRNLKYTLEVAEENKKRVTALPQSITTSSITSGSNLALTSGGAYTNLVRRLSSTSATGSVNQGVYVNASGQIQSCNSFLPISTLTSGDADNITTEGIYRINKNSFPNLPTTNWGLLHVFTNGTRCQYWFPDSVNVCYKRYGNPWGNWTKIATSNPVNVSTSGTPVGSSTQPVYVNSSGTITACTAPSVTYSSTSTNAISGKGVAEAIKNLYSKMTGEVIFSLDPLTDSSLHLLDGSLLNASGVYADFINKYIKPLYSSHPDRFKSESQWQSIVSQYGVCGYYVYNSSNNTVRLPKLTGFVEGTLNVNGGGEFTSAGLPNITGEGGMGESRTSGGTYDLFKNQAKGAIYYKADRSYYGSAGGIDADDYLMAFDASLSNPIYKNSFDKVQPQSIKGFYYVVVASSTKTDMVVNVDNITTDLGNKADRDLVNATPTLAFGNAMNQAGMPVIIKTYINGTSGYRIWSDGYCEQWGLDIQSNGTFEHSIALLKTYKDTNYNVILSKSDGFVHGNNGQSWTSLVSQTVNSFKIKNNVVSKTSWRTCGYLATGQY